MIWIFAVSIIACSTLAATTGAVWVTQWILDAGHSVALFHPATAILRDNNLSSSCGVS